MANEKTLEEMAQPLRTYSRGELLSALHKTALRYAAMSEKKAKHKASAVLTPRTGHLVQSITGRAKKRNNEIVIALNAGGGRKDVKYAKVHEQGGKRGTFFTIRPKNFPPGKLIFPVGEEAFTPVGVARGDSEDKNVKWVSVNQVRIPSRPFLRPTWLLIQKKLVKDVTKLLGEEILK